MKIPHLGLEWAVPSLFLLFFSAKVSYSWVDMSLDTLRLSSLSHVSMCHFPRSRDVIKTHQLPPHHWTYICMPVWYSRLSYGGPLLLCPVLLFVRSCQSSSYFLQRFEKKISSLKQTHKNLQLSKMKFIISHLRHDKKTKQNSALLLSFLTKLTSEISY